MSSNSPINAISKVPRGLIASTDVSKAYVSGSIELTHFDARANSMTNIANKVNEAMGLSSGTDGIQKNYNLAEDYNNGGMSRFFTYNAPGNVTFFSIA